VSAKAFFLIKSKYNGMTLLRLGARLTPQQERMKDTMAFFLRLMVFAVPLYLIVFFADLYPLQAAVAHNSFVVLEGMGLSPSIQGAEMAVGNFHFFISKDSTGWKSMLFLGALVFAVPGVFLRKKLLGVLIGIPIIYLGNLGRVVGIVLTEQAYGFEAAMLVHDWLWRFGLIALVLVVWLVWFKLSRANNKRRGIGSWLS